MPGGLLQLVGVGVQNQFVNGNPSMTYFNAMYKRFTNFAMEHFRVEFKGKDFTLNSTGSKIFRSKIPRYADMLHDCYVCINIPNIYSPISLNRDQTTGTPYEFKWIPNLGYNMIEDVTLLINGSPIVNMTGEWMKLLTYLKFSRTKRNIIDEMTGNIPELYNPAYGAGRKGNYPHSVQKVGGNIPAPSIPGRQLTIPLPFWFCEEIGQALPLIALTEAEVEIVIQFKDIYSLFTINDVRQYNPASSQTVNTRYKTQIPGIPGDQYLGIQNFLSPPTSVGYPTRTDLQSWNTNLYLEANYIFLTDTERAHIAALDRTYLIVQPRYIKTKDQYGFNINEIPMFNLCTRIVAVFQRTDRVILNDVDNYTNWSNPRVPQLITDSGDIQQLYISGEQSTRYLPNQDILQEGTFVFDGKERFATKNAYFYRLIQNYKYTYGETISLPGIYQYSFAIEPSKIVQPSGSVNGSMFNKVNANLTLGVPPATLEVSKTQTCILKSTALDSKPTAISANDITTTDDEKLTIVNKSTTNNQDYQFEGTIYVESINFLKVTSGIANIVFST